MSYSSEALKRFNYLLSETTTVYHDAAARLGLSYSVMQILYTVCSDGDGLRCPLSDVCRQTGISKQTVNSALRRLEAEGLAYLERAGGEAQGRVPDGGGRGPGGAHRGPDYGGGKRGIRLLAPGGRGGVPGTHGEVSGGLPGADPDPSRPLTAPGMSGPVRAFYFLWSTENHDTAIRPL